MPDKKNIIFCITGAGQFLEDACKFIKKLSEQGKYEITIAFSSAGYEVLCMYGLEKIKNYAGSVILEKDQGKSAPFCGRLSKKDYDFVVVAPATANTVSKIACGIADTLVTNIVAQAGKTNTPVFILPTDAEKFQETEIPASIDNKKCESCEYLKNCPCVEVCPNNAIFLTEKKKLRINLMLCNACRKCIPACNYGAVSFGKIVEIQCRDLDIENAGKLEKIEGITVIENLEEIKI